MTFITPQLHAQASPVTRIRLVDQGQTYQDSFIAGSILTPDNRSAFFFFVPDTVDFTTSQLFIKDKPVQLKQREHHTAFYEDQTRVVYILRATNQAEMISLITSENLHIVQPQRP